MSDTKTGGPAFPTARVNINGVDEQNGIQAFGAGMSLRDYFAAKALQGMMASRYPETPRFHPEDDAAYVYAVADAMLKERGQA